MRKVGGCGGMGCQLAEKEHKKTFWSNRNGQDISYVRVRIYQNSVNYTLKICVLYYVQIVPQ